MVKYTWLTILFCWTASDLLATASDINSPPPRRLSLNSMDDVSDAEMVPVPDEVPIDLKSLPTCKFSLEKVRMTTANSQVMDIADQPNTVVKVYPRIACDAGHCRGGRYCPDLCIREVCRKEFQGCRRVIHAMADPPRTYGRRCLMAVKGLYGSGCITGPAGNQQLVGPVVKLEALGMSFERIMGTVHGLRPYEVLAICWRIAEAVEFLHRQGLVHTDIQPHHVLLDPNGIAKLGGHRWVVSLAESDIEANQPESGQYLAPELRGDGDDRGTSQMTSQAAVFSLVATCLAMITNSPFHRDRFEETKIPEDLRAIFKRGLSNDPDLRPSACDIAGEIDAYFTRVHLRIAGARLNPRRKRVVIKVDDRSCIDIMSEDLLSSDELRDRVFLEFLIRKPSRAVIRSGPEVAYFEKVPFGALGPTRRLGSRSDGSVITSEGAGRF